MLSLGPETKAETPLPDLVPGDRLLAFAELELTTDAEDPEPSGPDRQRLLLRAEGRGDAALAATRTPRVGRRRSSSPPAWRQAVTHQRHHAVVTFGDAGVESAAGQPWQGLP